MRRAEQEKTLKIGREPTTVGNKKLEDRAKTAGRLGKEEGV
jgi:hypothetical protein